MIEIFFNLSDFHDAIRNIYAQAVETDFFQFGTGSRYLREEYLYSVEESFTEGLQDLKMPGIIFVIDLILYQTVVYNDGSEHAIGIGIIERTTSSLYFFEQLFPLSDVVAQV